MEHLLKHRSLSALQFSEFRYYIIARFFFIMVLTMQATLIGWEVFAITRDPFSIGLIGLVEFVPAVVMAIYSGYIIDRTDKKRLLHWSIAGNLALTVLFTYITSKHALETFDRTFILISIYCIAFLTGVARAFSGPTSFALVSALIPKEHLPNAISWHSSSWQIAAVSGPAIGGLLYGEAGITFAFGIMIVMLLTSVVVLFFISPKPPTGNIDREPMLQSIQKGFRFVWNTKEILGVLSLDLFAVFFWWGHSIIALLFRCHFRCWSRRFRHPQSRTRTGSHHRTAHHELYAHEEKSRQNHAVVCGRFRIVHDLIWIVGIFLAFVWSFDFIGHFGWHQCHCSVHHFAIENTR